MDKQMRTSGGTRECKPTQQVGDGHDDDVDSNAGCHGATCHDHQGELSVKNPKKKQLYIHDTRHNTHTHRFRLDTPRTRVILMTGLEGPSCMPLGTAISQA